MEEEIWKELVPDLYEVSSYGKVRSASRLIKRGVYGDYVKEGRVLKGSPNNQGYAAVTLSDGCDKVTMFIHRLVAETFIENPKALPEVNHKDGNKLNNTVNNLEWSSGIDNLLHARTVGISTTGLGSANRMAKLKEEDVSVIKQKFLNGKTDSEIARSFNVNKNTINDIRTGKSWKHVI